MSADNGIYIGKFPRTDGGIEYRVVHAQAIDNVDYGDTEHQDLYRVLYFGKAPVFSDADSAWEVARICSKNYDILEYGVSELEFDRPLLNLSVEEAEARLRAGE